MPMKDISGKKFGKLLAVKPSYKNKHNKTVWLCKCECGNDSYADIGSLVSGNTKSCGCNKYTGMLDYTKTKKENGFGVHHQRARNTWSKMINRCENPTDPYWKDYGGRGISVCDRWKNLRNFVEDMGDPPDGMSLDRWPDKNGNYEPGNCRWATASEQARNTRRNINLLYQGELICLMEFAKLVNISPSTIYERFKRISKLPDFSKFDPSDIYKLLL